MGVIFGLGYLQGETTGKRPAYKSMETALSDELHDAGVNRRMDTSRTVAQDEDMGYYMNGLVRARDLVREHMKLEGITRLE